MFFSCRRPVTPTTKTTKRRRRVGEVGWRKTRRRRKEPRSTATRDYSTMASFSRYDSHRKPSGTAFKNTDAPAAAVFISCLDISGGLNSRDLFRQTSRQREKDINKTGGEVGPFLPRSRTIFSRRAVVRLIGFSKKTLSGQTDFVRTGTATQTLSPGLRHPSSTHCHH